MLKLKDGILVESCLIEYNCFFYILLGVGVIIFFWNFLFVIMVGMIIVVLVFGNIVLLKLVSIIFVVVVKFMEVLEEVGLLVGVVNFVLGNGFEVGDYLVDYFCICFVSFMGFCDVGICIYECVVKVNLG